MNVTKYLFNDSKLFKKFSLHFFLLVNSNLAREIFIDFNEMVSKGNDRHSRHSQRRCFFIFRLFIENIEIAIKTR